MTNLYTQAESNILKTWVYLSFLVAIVVIIGWLISYYSGNQMIFWFFLIFSVLINFFAYWFSDKIVLSMSKAQPIKKEDNPELYRIVENLAITAGLPTPKVYIIEEAQPNAFATGRNPQNSALAVTRGLLKRLERVELEGVIAHELAHIGNRDILLSTLVVVLVGVIIRLIDFSFRISHFREERRNDTKANLIIFLIALGLVILAPLLATLIRLAISRKREFLADASGALLTRYPEGLARALEKISKDPTPLKVASDATAHLYIASPFRGREQQSWLHRLFSTHPPVGERIKVLRGMEI